MYARNNWNYVIKFEFIPSLAYQVPSNQLLDSPLNCFVFTQKTWGEFDITFTASPNYALLQLMS